MLYKLCLNRAEAFYLCRPVHEPVDMIGLLCLNDHRRRQRKFFYTLHLHVKAVIVHLHELCVDTGDIFVTVSAVVDNEENTPSQLVMIPQSILDTVVFAALAL